MRLCPGDHWRKWYPSCREKKQGNSGEAEKSFSEERISKCSQLIQALLEALDFVSLLYWSWMTTSPCRAELHTMLWWATVNRRGCRVKIEISRLNSLSVSLISRICHTHSINTVSMKFGNVFVSNLISKSWKCIGSCWLMSDMFGILLKMILTQSFLSLQSQYEDYSNDVVIFTIKSNVIQGDSLQIDVCVAFLCLSQSCQ